jgi:hypothetical protein
MKCRICASECPPGAKLCRDCAAARKRAFAATVTQPLLAAAGAPSVGRPRFAPRPERPRPERHLTSKKPVTTAARSEAVMAASAAEGNAATPAHRPIGVQWLLLGLAIACAVVYLLVRILFQPHGQPGDSVLPSDAASQVMAPAEPAGAGVGAPAMTALPSPGASASAAAAQADVEAAEAKAEAALRNAAAKAARRKAAAKVEAPAIAPAEPAVPPPVAVLTPRAPPPPAVEVPRDPWQAMNEGLSRCAREDWMNRAACEQRLRLQYCPGHWGLVWQCPVGPADHGQ